MSNQWPLEVEVGGSILNVVPAVHFRVAFAEEVNALCCNPAARPDAIAVELGPRRTQAARQWMLELGISPAAQKRLPCMLGLAGTHRFLRPELRERAVQLQLETGKELHELPTDILEYELGYHASTMSFLSPTDSIVEAVRCACELDVPVYGVDLEESAELLPKKEMLVDPASANGKVGEYVHQLLLSEPDSADAVNRRREVAMAACLKTLLQRHRRVLFTCGLMHWRRILRLLRDIDLRPGKIDLEPAQSTVALEFRRTLVHPLAAVNHMDLLPAVAGLFEHRRRHPLLSCKDRRPDSINAGVLFTAHFRQVCTTYFFTDDNEPLDPGRGADWAVLSKFERQLENYHRLALRAVPDFGSALVCARSMMSGAFCESLVRTFTDFPWAVPKDFPDCQVVETQSEYFASPWEAPAKLPWDWGREHRSNSHTHTWEPWDNLVTGLSELAIGMGEGKQRVSVAERFAGDFLEGIDLRKTMRAQIRGRDEIFVRDSRFRRGQKDAVSPDGYPVVWIFDLFPEGDSQWEHFLEPTSCMLPHARDPRRLKRRCAQQGGNMLAVIGLCERSKKESKQLRGPVVSLYRFRGFVNYSPIFPSCRQYARWLELTDCRRNPFYGTSTSRGIPDTLAALCADTLGQPVGQLGWQDDLVRFAIPFAASQVTVVAPSSFRLSPKVCQEARRQGKALQLVSLEAIPESLWERMRMSYMVRSHFDQAEGRPIYDGPVEDILGEKRTRFHDMVPTRWRTMVSRSQKRATISEGRHHVQ